MKNLAGVETCDADIRRELMGANIAVEAVEKTRSEVPYTLIGKLCGWTFKRAWYYWMASAPEGEGVHETDAESLNEQWHNEVRVAGFAGGTKVSDRLSSRKTIDSYHIDTPEGLNVLAKLIKKLSE